MFPVSLEGHLCILDVTRGDQGQYRCRINNTAATVYEVYDVTIGKNRYDGLIWGTYNQGHLDRKVIFLNNCKSNFESSPPPPPPISMLLYVLGGLLAT